MEGSILLGVDLRLGCLFRTLNSSRQEVTDNPVSSHGMYDRLKKIFGGPGIVWRGNSPWN